MIEVGKRLQRNIHITCFKLPTLVLFFLEKGSWSHTVDSDLHTQIVNEAKSVTKETYRLEINKMKNWFSLVKHSNEH